MAYFSAMLRAFVFLAASQAANAAIGPVADLTMTSANVNPDGATGFDRDGKEQDQISSLC
jgi:hypothetical protein